MFPGISPCLNSIGFESNRWAIFDKPRPPPPVIGHFQKKDSLKILIKIVAISLFIEFLFFFSLLHLYIYFFFPSLPPSPPSFFLFLSLFIFHLFFRSLFVSSVLLLSFLFLYVLYSIQSGPRRGAIGRCRGRGAELPVLIKTRQNNNDNRNSKK